MINYFCSTRISRHIIKINFNLSGLHPQNHRRCTGGQRGRAHRPQRHRPTHRARRGCVESIAYETERDVHPFRPCPLYRRHALSTNSRIEGRARGSVRFCEAIETYRLSTVSRRPFGGATSLPHPLPAAEIIRVLPTNKSRAATYERMEKRKRGEGAIPR